MSTIVKKGACPSAIIQSYKNGDFTDLTITCGRLTFKVHAVVVCSSSDFFRKSITFAVGKEAENKCIDLPEDSPEMIRRLIAFLYLGDYDPCVEIDISSFDSIVYHESSTIANPTYHPRKGAPDGSLFPAPQCACLSPNGKKFVQPMATMDVDATKYITKGIGMIQVANPLTIHATMYALGDKYQVKGLAEVAKAKFESCVREHARTEDFISAVQSAYSTTPDSNRGLRDAVIDAFRTEFKANVKEIPGAEAKLDCIDELSFLLIKSWPNRTESIKSVNTSSSATTGLTGSGQGVTSTPPQGSQPAPARSLFGTTAPAPTNSGLFGGGGRSGNSSFGNPQSLPFGAVSGTGSGSGSLFGGRT